MPTLRTTLLSASALTFALLTGPAIGTANAADVVDGPKVHWNYSLWGKPRAATRYMELLSEWLPERTDGNFTLQLHWGTLSKPRANLDGLKLGAFQGATFCASYYPGKLDSVTGLDLPFLPWTNLYQLAKVSEAYLDHEVPKGEFAKWGSSFYMSSTLPLYEVIGKGEPIRNLDGWKGQRIRALGQQGQAFEKLEAVPTSVPAPEVYTSMDRGLLDSVSFGNYAHLSYRTYELGDWFTTGMKVGSIACGSLFNTEALNQLPEQYRALLQEFEPVGYEKQVRNMDQVEEETAPATFREAGLEEVKVSPEMRMKFQEVGGKPVWSDWVQKMDELGYDGQDLLDTILTAADEYKDSTGM